VIWEEGEQDYCPVYLERREEINEHQGTHAIMLVIWEEGEQDYCPVYLERREEINEHQGTHAIIVAAYHLFSETKIGLDMA